MVCEGRVLSLVSVYGPVSGARFDDERRIMFDSLSVILGSLPLRSVWVVGGDFNAEIGFQGVGEESMVGPARTLVGGLGLGINWWNGLQGEDPAISFVLYTTSVVGTHGSTLRVGQGTQSIISFVGLAIIGLKPLGHHGRPTRIITRLRSNSQRGGYTVLLHELRASFAGAQLGCLKGFWGGCSGC